MSERILVIKLGALGDFIYALGAMRAIREHHKGAHITLLTRKAYEDLARKSGLFDEILLDPKPKLNPLAWLKFRKTLNALDIGRVYDLQNNDRSGQYLRLFTLKPEWVGVAKGASHRNTDPDRCRYHAFQGHKKTLALAGIKDVTLDSLDWLRADLTKFGLPSPYILMVPGSSTNHPEKRWPASHYRALAEKFVSEGFYPVIIGSASERDMISEISKNISVTDLSGRTDIADLASLGRSARFAIGNDTGPMHIISMTGCPCVMLFSTAKSWIEKHGPQVSTAEAIEAKNMSDISIDQVWDRAESALRRQF